MRSLSDLLGYLHDKIMIAYGVHRGGNQSRELTDSYLRLELFQCWHPPTMHPVQMVLTYQRLYLLGLMHSGRPFATYRT